ncbi:MAG: hypothetical protein IKK09_01435 [Clostridia bacterium]|nr:hypothetical protein [Clostridia bacterium]
MKNIVLLVCQLSIILLAYFLVWGDAILILGIAGIIVQCVFSLKIIGWISAIAYPITYLIAVLCDTPLYDVPNNLYVYWYLSYIALILIGLVVDLILKNRKSN